MYSGKAVRALADVMGVDKLALAKRLDLVLLVNDLRHAISMLDAMEAASKKGEAFDYTVGLKVGIQGLRKDLAELEGKET